MSDEVFSRIELADPGEVERAGMRLLEEQLRYVADTSAFYRKKLGPNAGSRRDRLADLPFTTKDELREAQRADPPFGELRAASQTDIVRLHVTSGTTGRPVAIGFTHEDHELSCEVGARAYFAAGIRPEDTVLHCLNYSLYVGGLADHLSIERIGATMVPVGIGQSERILDLWGDLRPTGIFSTPSYARHLAEVARNRGVDPRDLGLRLLVVGGEPGGDVAEIRRALEDTWNAQVADAYGLGEVWPTFAGQCAYKEGLHLTAPDALWWELIDPDTGGSIEREPGAMGEAVYTHLRRRATPLVRYRSGDMVQLLDRRCPCGRSTPRVRLLGRADSMFIVRGVNVFPQAVEAVLDELLPGHGAFAILLDEAMPAPPIRVVVEVSDGPEVAHEIESAIRSRLQFTSRVELVGAGALALTTEHKSKRVFRTYLGESPPGLASVPRHVGVE